MASRNNFLNLPEQQVSDQSQPPPTGTFPEEDESGQHAAVVATATEDSGIPVEQGGATTATDANVTGGTEDLNTLVQPVHEPTTPGNMPQLAAAADVAPGFGPMDTSPAMADVVVSGTVADGKHTMMSALQGMGGVPDSETSLLSASTPPQTGGVKRKRFSAEQKQLLLRSFQEDPYPSADTIAKLASQCDTDEHKIRTWFCNTRVQARLKKGAAAGLVPVQETPNPATELGAKIAKRVSLSRSAKPRKPKGNFNNKDIEALIPFIDKNIAILGSGSPTLLSFQNWTETLKLEARQWNWAVRFLKAMNILARTNFKNRMLGFRFNPPNTTIEDVKKNLQSWADQIKAREASGEDISSIPLMRIVGKEDEEQEESDVEDDFFEEDEETSILLKRARLMPVQEQVIIVTAPAADHNYIMVHRSMLETMQQRLTTLQSHVVSMSSEVDQLLKQMDHYTASAAASTAYQDQAVAQNNVGTSNAAAYSASTATAENAFTQHIVTGPNGEQVTVQVYTDPNTGNMYTYDQNGQPIPFGGEAQ